jgi:two-component system chemotaxis response regulator CheY
MNSNAPHETIVIAEDSAPNRKILAHLLTRLGYNVVATENGQAAWNALTSGEHKNIVLLVSDIMMPVMDGLALLRQVRENPKLKPLPVVLVTAVVEQEYLLLAKDMNVNGYILKPVTYDRVTAKLSELFPEKTFPKLAG